MCDADERECVPAVFEKLFRELDALEIAEGDTYLNGDQFWETTRQR